MTSRSSRICSFRPPTDENVTSPGSSDSMVNTLGSTSRGSARMMVYVMMSSVTRVPDVSFALSTFLRQPTTNRGPCDTFTMKRSSSSCFNTSPINCPWLCRDLMSSSVRAYRRFTSRSASFRAFTLH